MHCSLKIFIEISDKAGLKWQGFNAPVKVEGRGKRDAVADEEPEKHVRLKKTFARGWTGKTWPGRKSGHPVTADGGSQIKDLFLHLALFSNSIEVAQQHSWPGKIFKWIVIFDVAKCNLGKV